jgi:hypothetical protein
LVARRCRQDGFAHSLQAMATPTAHCTKSSKPLNKRRALSKTKGFTQKLSFTQKLRSRVRKLPSTGKKYWRELMMIAAHRLASETKESRDG